MQVAHARALLARQSFNGALNGAKGGWDKCMTETGCKVGAIIGIVVGVLIILSLLFCCLRCLCCGAECCCGCLACCNACCPSPRRRGRKVPQSDNYGYKPTSVSPNAPQTQYQSHPPPTYTTNTGPQYAHFDVGGKRGGAHNPDSLPSMPTWDNSEDRKIETFDHLEHDIEHHGSAGSGAALAAGAGTAGLRPGMYDRQGSHSNSNSNSRYSPAGESETYLGSHDYNQSATGISRYGGAATGGYRGAAPAPPVQQSPYGTPSNRSPTKPQFASAAPQQQGYSAYSPHAAGAASGGAAPSYPGQKTYQAGARSPTSQTNYSGSTKVEPSLAYPDNYRPQTELSEPDSHVEGWTGGVGQQASGMSRKPVDGSWRDI